MPHLNMRGLSAVVGSLIGAEVTAVNAGEEESVGLEGLEAIDAKQQGHWGSEYGYQRQGRLQSYIGKKPGIIFQRVSTGKCLTNPIYSRTLVLDHNPL